MRPSIFLIPFFLILVFSCTNQKQDTTEKLSEVSVELTTDTLPVKNMFIKPELVTKYTLGEKGFFEDTKDSQSYLPIDFVYNNQKLLFLPGKSKSFEFVDNKIIYLPEINRNIICYDLIKKTNLDNKFLNKKISETVTKESYVEKLFINNNDGLILFNDFSIAFNQKNNSLYFKTSYEPPKGDRYVISSDNNGYYYFNEYKITEVDMYGQILNEKEITLNVGSNFYYYSKGYMYISTGEIFNISEIIHNKPVKKILIHGLSNEFVIIGISDKYTVWVKSAISSNNSVDKINELFFVDLKTEKIIAKVTIDPSILNGAEIDQTFYPDMPGAVDPPELRQYIRICYGDGKYYLMFQSKKVIYIYSFSLPS